MLPVLVLTVIMVAAVLLRMMHLEIQYWNNPMAETRFIIRLPSGTTTKVLKVLRYALTYVSPYYGTLLPKGQ